MKIIFENFKFLKEEKPTNLQACLILWQAEDKTNTTVGIYHSDKKAFFDGIGAWLEEKDVRMWTDADNYKIE